MIVLGLDSSAKTAGVAIVRSSADGAAALLYEGYLATGYTHSETLLQLVDDALRACRLAVSEVDVYALTAGPGSFTGLRIGMALIKGLAAAKAAPCVALSTLQALAAGWEMPGVVVPAMDARRAEVYTAAFVRRADGTLQRITDDDARPAADTAAAAAALAQQHGLPAILLGDGAHLVAAAWPTEAAAPTLVSAAQRTRAAGPAALLGAAAAAAGDTLPAAELRPDYHRLCQAERERAEKLAAEAAQH